MIREPIVAGSFYSVDKHELVTQIEECFKHRLGPGEMPDIEKKTDKRVRAIISPHAGYLYSGACAAHGYLALSKAKTPKNILLLGLSHEGRKTALSREQWETPLGKTETDIVLLRKISELGIPVNEDAHRNEHSIETQIPFLQFIYPNMPKIVPLVVSIDCDPVDLGKKISEVIDDDTLIVVSSDFTHYGPQYGFVPFETDVKTQLYEMDRRAIGFITHRNHEGFQHHIVETGTTICGSMPIKTLIPMLKENGKVLKYYTSGDISRSYANAVGYASILFEK